MGIISWGTRKGAGDRCGGRDRHSECDEQLVGIVLRAFELGAGLADCEWEFGGVFAIQPVSDSLKRYDCEGRWRARNRFRARFVSTLKYAKGWREAPSPGAFSEITILRRRRRGCKGGIALKSLAISLGIVVLAAVLALAVGLPLLRPPKSIIYGKPMAASPATTPSRQRHTNTLYLDRPPVSTGDRGNEPVAADAGHGASCRGRRF